MEEELRKIIAETFHDWGEGYGHNGDPDEAKAALFAKLMDWHKGFEVVTVVVNKWMNKHPCPRCNGMLLMPSFKCKPCKIKLAIEIRREGPPGAHLEH